MSLSQIESPDAARGLARLDPFRFLKRFLPRGLFWRSLLIIVTPVVLLQGVVSYVFFERDLESTTHWMARDIAADASFLVALEDSHTPAERASLRAQASLKLGYPVTFLPGGKIAAPARLHRPSTIDKALDELIAQQAVGGRTFEVTSAAESIQIDIQANDGVLRMVVPRSRVTVTGPDIFIVWMVGSSLILLAVAILFLRNQVRPIERLALASEAFGKGRAVPDFKPYGASEVRRAARAFLTMRERIERHVQQRTEMLAGISHDLKTPLSRMKLQLAMMDDSADTKAMRADRFARIVVDDDGPGIAPERREEAFRPFHRLDKGRNLQAGGSGLGLAIARDIARGHGGDILLDKSPLGGLRATIRLPI